MSMSYFVGWSVSQIFRVIIRFAFTLRPQRLSLSEDLSFGKLPLKRQGVAYAVPAFLVARPNTTPKGNFLAMSSSSSPH